jgi:hypothetical protein
MPRPPQPDRLWSEGQSAPEQALWCVSCELILAGTAHCPRCGDEVVWPLTQWVPLSLPAMPATT